MNNSELLEKVIKDFNKVCINGPDDIKECVKTIRELVDICTKMMDIEIEDDDRLKPWRYALIDFKAEYARFVRRNERFLVENF